MLWVMSRICGHVQPKATASLAVQALRLSQHCQTFEPISFRAFLLVEGLQGSPTAAAPDMHRAFSEAEQRPWVFLAVSTCSEVLVHGVHDRGSAGFPSQADIGFFLGLELRQSCRHGGSNAAPVLGLVKSG